MLRKFSLKQKLLILTSAILIVPNIVLVAGNLNEAKTQMENIMEKNQAATVKLLDSTITDHYSKTFHEVDYVSKALSMYKNQDEKDEVLSRVKELTQSDSDSVDAYIGYSDKEFYQYPSAKMPDGFDPTVRPWYQQAIKNSGKVIVTDPYVSKSSGEMVVTIAEQLPDKSGVLGLDINIDSISKIISEIKLGDLGYAFAFGKSGLNIVHPDFKIGQDLTNVSYLKPIFATDNGNDDYSYNGKNMNLQFVKNQLTGWKVGAVYNMAEINTMVNPIGNFSLIISVVSLVIALVIIYFVLSAMIKPINRLKEIAGKVAEGDLKETVEVKSADEVGQLGNAFNKMIESLRDMVSSIASTSENLASSSEELSASTEENVSSIRQISQSIQEISDGSNEQLHSTNNVSKVIHDISEDINDITRNVDTVAESTVETSNKANDGVNVIQEAIKSISLVKTSALNTEKDLNILVDKVSDILKFNVTISELAQQTKMLSLNAAIEASHAGDLGKGFAVVAEEIRLLADQSKDAAKQIGYLIDEINVSTKNASTSMAESVSSVEIGNEKVLEAGHSFEDIVRNISELSRKMSEIKIAVDSVSHGTEEMVQSFTEISNVSEEITSSIDNVASVTEQQNASMEDISKASEALTLMAEELREIVSKFEIEE